MSSPSDVRYELPRVPWGEGAALDHAKRCRYGCNLCGVFDDLPRIPALEVGDRRLAFELEQGGRPVDARDIRRAERENLDDGPRRLRHLHQVIKLLTPAPLPGHAELAARYDQST